MPSYDIFVFVDIRPAAAGRQSRGPFRYGQQRKKSTHIEQKTDMSAQVGRLAVFPPVRTDERVAAIQQTRLT